MSSSSSAQMMTTTTPNSTSGVSRGEIARLRAAVENVGERLASLERSDHSRVAEVMRRLENLETDTAHLQQTVKNSQVRSPNRSKSTKLIRCNRKIKEAASAASAVDERTESEYPDTGGALSVEIAAIVAQLLVQVTSLDIGLKIQDEEIGRLRKDVDKLKRNEFQLLMMKPVSGCSTGASDDETRQPKPQTAAAAPFAAGNSDEVGIEKKAIRGSREEGYRSAPPLSISELRASLMYARRAERCATATKSSQTALGDIQELLLKNAANCDDDNTTETICDMEVDTVAEEQIDPNSNTEKTHGDSKREAEEQLPTRYRLVKPEVHDYETLCPQVPKVHRKLRSASLQRQVRSELPRTPHLEDHGSRSRKEGSEGKFTRSRSLAKKQVVDSADDHADESCEDKNGSSQPHAPEELSSSVEGKEGARIQDVPAAVDSGNVLAAQFYLDDDAMTKKVLEAYEI